MSGSSRVQLQSEYFHLSSESPCMNFAYDPRHPDVEARWHQSWMQRGEQWLPRAKAILEQRFGLLAELPDPHWPIVKYQESYPLWNSYRTPEAPPPWRLGFVGMSGPGMTQVTLAFSRMPSEEARERLKQELIKDLAMLDSPDGVI